MKKLIIVTFLLTATAAFSADQPPQSGQGQNFDQIKSTVVSRINARIAHNQEELTCVQAAKNHADLKACREKFRAEQKEQHEQGQHREHRQQ